jgi:hypothetical protein
VARLVLDEVGKLRSLAAHYRALAARAENRSVREDRMCAAALLEREAAYTESAFIHAPAQLARAAVELDQGFCLAPH